MDQSCINRSIIPNFKFLADHHQVSEDMLATIIYKYRNETGNENAVPTDVYVQAQIGKIQYLESNPSTKKVWDKFYSTPKEFTSEQKFQEAKQEAETLFPKHAVIGYVNHKGNRTLAVKEPVEKITPKHRKDYKTWQEYNDYLLVMGDLIPESAREKEQQLIGKQPFTFNDGTTVTVPFRPNSQQEEALNEMNDFLKSNETTMTLSGYAGTGKTSLMEIIAAKAKQAGKKIIFSASTNKAASVLRDRVKSAGYMAETLNKVFGIAVTVDESQPYDESTLKNVRTEAGVTNGAVVVIDEASMINMENYRILNEIAQQNNLKIIYVGDKGQLPPVNESQVSKVFRDATNRRVNLTKVERTDDNAILQEATNIRNGQPLSGESSFNKEGKGVAYVKKSNKEAKKAIVERFVPYLKQNPDYFRILVYTNAAVAQYNTAVRNALGYTDNTPRVGEPIVGYKNWGQISYNKKTKQSTYKFINSESYKVAEVGKPKQIVKTLDNGTSVTLQAIPVTLEDNMGEKNSFDFIDVKGNHQNLQAATILAQEKAKLHDQARDLRGEAYARAKAKINDLEKFLFINADIEDKTKVNAKGKHPLLQGKVFDFGYAMTVHKSQGSTFTHVMVDDADIATARNTTNIDFGTPINLSFGEESYEAYEGTEADMVGPMQDITLDWDNPSPTTTVSEAPASESNAVNIRQQLEYVAVSRATDTVTIIANDANVKKEDTPLNHIKETSQDNNAINQQESRSNKTANLISATIAPYFNTSYEDYAAMTPEEQKEMRVAFAKAAKEVAKALGISLDMNEASFNIGGYEFDDGGSVVEPSFTFRLDTTPENARLFAALMGDLGYEQQEAVVSNYDIEDRDNADGIRFSLEFKDSATLLKLINQFGIKNFTYDKTNGVLSVLSFDTADVEKFHNLVQQLKENGYDKESETFYFKSSYDGRTGRKTLYGKWFKAQEGNSKGVQSELYSLVQEALKRVNYYSGKPSNYEGLIEPDENTVFVFGSNPKGIHGAGAANTAKTQFGAIQGQGEGMQGNAYALPTKDLDKAKGTRWYKPGKKEETEVKEWYKNHDYSEVQNHPLNAERTMTPQQIIGSIKKLYEVANQNPDKQFKVSHYPFGQLSLNGYLGEEMLAMFKQAGQIPSNIVFNKEWTDHWDEIQSTQQQTKNFTVDEIYNQLKSQYAPNSSEAKLTDIVFQALRNTGVKFKAADLGDGVSGRFVASENTILYNPNALQSNTLLHEAIHAVTSYYLEAENTQGFSKEIKVAIQEIEECYNLLKQDFIEEWKKKGVEINDSNFSFWIEGNDTYGLTDSKEMIAELGKPEFVEHIKSFDRRHKGQNIFQRLKNAIFTLFGINKNYGNLESTLKNALVTFLTNPNNELIQRYSQENTNVKNNHKALVGSKHITINNEVAVKEMLKNLSEVSSEEYADTSIVLNEESIPYSFTKPEGANVTRLSALKEGSIFIYNNAVFMSLNGTPRLENEKAIIPIRVYSKKGLTLNKFNIQRNSDGIDYIKTTTALFPEVQPIIQQPTQQQTSVPNATPLGNFRTYGEAYGTVERDNLVQELLDNDYSREDIQVQHIPATDTEDDYYLVKVRDNTQTMVDAITQTNTFVPYPLQMQNLGIETGERVIQVNAEWKAPILQDLDYQLGQVESETEKDNILQQIHRVYEATSEEDYLKAPTAERQEVNDKMSDYWRRNNQINALMDNEVGLAASEIKEVAEQVVNSISDIITEIQANPEKIKEYFPTLNIKKDLSTVSRKEIAQTVNINNLINEAKRRFENIRYDESNQEAYDLYADSFELMDQADLILDNWDTIMELAADVFVVNEGFSIKRNTKKQSFETTDREFTGYDYDNFTDPQDEDAVREEKDEQEHWQVEARTIDAFNSMSEQVRLAYHNCYELDRNGNKVLDKWGIPKRVNKVKAVAQTLRWTQGALDINEMIEKLHQKESKNPWLSQILEKLEVKEGQENPNTDFQSQFYGVMHRHFQLYSIGQMDNGVYTSKTLNSHMALSEVMKSINAKFQLKGHPLFHNDGAVVLSSLNALKGWYKELTDLVKKYNIRTTNEGRLTTNGQLSEEDIDTAAKNLTAVSKMFGYNASEESVRNVVTERSLQQMWSKLRFAIDNLEKAGKGYDPFNFEADNNIRSEVMGFLTPIVEELEDVATNSFFDNGKMYQSYVIPSFLTQLFDQFKQHSDKVYQWMDEFYGQSEWFKDKEGNWKLPWLDMLSRDPKAREVFDHKVQLNFNKHDYMRNMSPEEFTLSVFMEYFSEMLNMKDLQHTPAWFRVPIQSNKPSSEFIKFYADRMPGYKERIAANMYGMFLQELSRIDTVRKRNLKEGDPGFIASFDENGRKFLFLPWLNPYLEDGSSELGKLLQKKLTATVENQLSEAEEARLMTLVQQETMNYMQQRTDNILQNWENTGILKAAEKIKGIKSLGNSVRENLENFLWNDFYAANSILQMTIVDKAFYPHATELQKRLAELHAPGTRGNKYATDYNGKRVSDGFYRTIIIQDLKGFTASIIDNITEIFDRKIANAPESEKPQWKALKESLVGEKGAYRRINVTDGQAYSSPSSYRKKAFMFGKWSRKAEDIYQRLLKGDFSISDLEVAFQPLKPFVYGHLSKNMGIDVAPITKMPVPFQAKNSEYLLILADALMRGQETGRPNLLKAIYDIMEESEKLHPGQGIDTVQFDSAIKSGNQAVIDITPYLTMPGGEAGAYTLMKKLIYQEGKTEDLTSYNYDTYVHKTDYDNYALQQEVPPHFREHQQAEGSQQRMNIPTDLDFYDYSGQENKYSWKDPNGTEHSMNAKEFRKEYERVHAANIEDSFNTLAKELHLNSTDRKARNLALSEILQDEIMSSPRYGIDLFQACQIDPATGEFRIPKGDPIQGKRIEQLINSIIKNRVNKQKISGGPIVQVTNFGTSKQLHIRFQDKNGNILMTKEEYEKSIKEQPASQTDKFNAKYGKKTSSASKSYKEYLKENQAGIAHFEIFAPIGMKKLFDKFKNPDGSINLEAVEKCDPELLKVITGRIPNEDKYSIAHGKIVGFMPALAGDAIMFPAELTEIDDSDFDVDKRYTMQKVIDIIEDKDKIEQRLFQVASDSYRKAHNGEISYAVKKKLNDTISMLMDNPERMKTADSLSASLYEEYQRILREEYPYKTKYPKKGTRDANNNQIIDMSWAVMSNEMTADKILNPGGFEIPKHTAYVIAAYRNSDGTISWEKLKGMSTKELQKLASVERDLAWFNDHVQFYKQNAAGSNLIGVFAVNKVAHATLEGDGLLINVAEFCGEKPFTICDTEFNGMMSIDSSKDVKGQLIGKNIGSGIGASADTAKDPWLDSININMTTAGIFNTLLRMGMPMEDAELFMAQDVILRLLTEFNRKNLEGSTTIDKVLQDRIDTIKKKYKYTDASEINAQPLTRDELREGLLPIDNEPSSERDAIDYKTLLAFQKLKVLAKAIRKPTLVTRLNSISSAVGPLIIDNIILEHKLREFLQGNDNDKTGFYKKNSDGTFSPVDMDDVLYDHPILKQFSRPIDSRKSDCPTKIMFNDMPAGSSLFKTVLNALPQNIDAKIYNDRQLLSKLSDFFQSYLLVANNVIKPEQLKELIEEFPKEFEGVGGHKSIKEQYPDNAFIQAIQLNYEEKSKRTFLNINTTGMKEQEKERLRMAWTDLHKVNPELSTKLFTYAFFRGGIGFSPKTWMGLTPIYVKEHIEGYVDTYRHFPKIVPEILLEQFIRNNWDNSTLVPRKGGENTNYQIDLAEGTLIPSTKQEWEDLDGIEYFKTVDSKNTYLWKLNKNRGLYTRIYPLGNNGEYIEISTTENMKPIDEITVMESNNDIQELPEASQMEMDAADAETPDAIPESDTQQAKTITDLIPAVMALDSRQSPTSAKKHLEDYVTRFKEGTLSKGHQKYLVNLLTKAGIEVSMDDVLEKFKEFC